MMIKRVRRGPKRFRAGRHIGRIATATIAYLVNACSKGAGPLRTIQRITGYILDDLHPARGNPKGEKVREFGQLNLTGETIVSWQADMAATAMAGHGADPIEHFVISWREDEVPARE